MEIRNASHGDVSALLRLSTQAGWNQLSADWHRLIDHSPNGCFAGWLDGELIATSTIISFQNDTGWIGMVLVDENHRRQGFGMQIFEHALNTAVDWGLSKVGLDATEAGRSVYEQVGFVDVTGIERWRGKLDRPNDTDSNFVVECCPLDEEVYSVDRQACSVDRSRLLDRLAQERGVRSFRISKSGTNTVRGFGIVRPGREAFHIGPVVASDGDAFASLLREVERTIGKSPVVIDLFIDDEVMDVARDANLEEQRTLTRMTYEEPHRVLQGDHVVAAAGFELG